MSDRGACTLSERRGSGLCAEAGRPVGVGDVCRPRVSLRGSPDGVLVQAHRVKRERASCRSEREGSEPLAAFHRSHSARAARARCLSLSLLSPTTTAVSLARQRRLLVPQLLPERDAQRTVRQGALSPRDLLQALRSGQARFKGAPGQSGGHLSGRSGTWDASSSHRVDRNEDEAGLADGCRRVRWSTYGDAGSWTGRKASQALSLFRSSWTRQMR